MINSVMQLAVDVATRFERPLKRVAAAMGISGKNTRRWLDRLQKGEPVVRQPGPKVFTSSDMSAAIHADARSLTHGYHRSFGTTALRAKYRGDISKRSLNIIVKQKRKEAVSESRKRNQRVEWYGSNIVWALDDTEVTRSEEHGKITLHQIRDLGSRYVFPPIESKNIPEGTLVAENLERLFKRNGAPLFLKRDNAKNFNNPLVDAVLANFGVLPLNSPPRYPKYNGAEERGQAELKNELERLLSGVNGWSLDTIAPFAHAAAHELNHMPRRVLNGAHACHIHATSRLRFSLNERKVIYDCIMIKRDYILQGEGGKVSPEKAWRRAVLLWLQESGLVTITAAENVSSDFQDEK